MLAEQVSVTQEGSKNEVCTEDVEEVQEPDWDSIAQHEPGCRDVPLFLNARERRDMAERQFASALDEAHKNLKECCDDLLNAAAAVFNEQKNKSDAMEFQIKQDFVANEESRANMEKRIEKSASAAAAKFSQLASMLKNKIGSCTKK